MFVLNNRETEERRLRGLLDILHLIRVFFLSALVSKFNLYQGNLFTIIKYTRDVQYVAPKKPYYNLT